MIELHHVGPDQEPFTLNPDRIVWIEERPGTVITLDNDNHLRVAETAEQIRDLVIEMRAQIAVRARAIILEAGEEL